MNKFKLTEYELLRALGDQKIYDASCDRELLEEWALSEDTIYAALLPFNTKTQLIIPPIYTVDKSTAEQKEVLEANSKRILEKMGPYVSENSEISELLIPVRTGVEAGHWQLFHLTKADMKNWNLKILNSIDLIKAEVDTDDYYKNARMLIENGLDIKINKWDYENLTLQYTNHGCGVILFVNAHNIVSQNPIKLTFGQNKNRPNELSKDCEMNLRMQLYVYFKENMEAIQSSFITEKYPFLEEAELEKLKNNLPTALDSNGIGFTYGKQLEEEANEEASDSASEENSASEEDSASEQTHPSTIKWTPILKVLFIVGCIILPPIALLALAGVCIYNKRIEKLSKEKSEMRREDSSQQLTYHSLGHGHGDASNSKPNFSKTPRSGITHSNSYSNRKHHSDTENQSSSELSQ